MKHLYTFMVHCSSVADNPGLVRTTEIIIGSLVFIILLGLVAGALIWKQKLRRSKTGECFHICHVL